VTPTSRPPPPTPSPSTSKFLHHGERTYLHGDNRSKTPRVRWCGTSGSIPESLSNPALARSRDWHGIVRDGHIALGRFQRPSCASYLLSLLSQSCPLGVGCVPRLLQMASYPPLNSGKVNLILLRLHLASRPLARFDVTSCSRSKAFPCAVSALGDPREVCAMAPTSCFSLQRFQYPCQLLDLTKSHHRTAKRSLLPRHEQPHGERDAKS